MANLNNTSVPSSIGGNYILGRLLSTKVHTSIPACAIINIDEANGKVVFSVNERVIGMLYVPDEMGWKLGANIWPPSNKYLPTTRLMRQDNNHAEGIVVGPHNKIIVIGRGLALYRNGQQVAIIINTLPTKKLVVYAPAAYAAWLSTM